MNANVPFVKSVEQWDKYLLQNHPRLWALRLPTLIGYVLIFNSLALVVSLAVPLKTYYATKFFIWLWLFGVVELIALGFWIKRFNWFSPEKAIEKTFPANGLVEIIVYMLCVATFLSPTITSSAVLELRFAGLAGSIGIHADYGKVSDFHRNESYYPLDLVEKYSRFDSSSNPKYLASSKDVRIAINRNIRSNINKLHSIWKGEDYEWQGYLIVAALLLHISVFMFAARNAFKGLVGKTTVYGIVIFIALLIFQGLAMGFIEFFTRYDSYDYSQRIWEGLLIFLLGFVLFFSTRVYWQKEYKTFTALNISLLPYVVYFEFIYWGDAYDHKFKLFKELFGYRGFFHKTFGENWGGLVQILIIGSPLLIVWVFIFTKSMYMRQLAQPEG